MSNEHWKVIQFGAITKAMSPEQLWQQAADYFEWCDNNPITQNRTLQTGKTQGQKIEVEYKRPYTIKGLCMHCGLSERYLKDISQIHGKESPWTIVVERILQVVYTQNLEGAIVEIFNPIIISRLLNLEKPQEEDSKNIRVEIVDTRKGNLNTNESDIMKDIDFELSQSFQSKLNERTFGKEHSTDK